MLISIRTTLVFFWLVFLLFSHPEQTRGVPPCPVLRCDPLPEIRDTLAFCPGDSVWVAGRFFTRPGVHVDTLPGRNGNCDTLVITVLRFLGEKQDAPLRMVCPPHPMVVTAVAEVPADPCDVAENGCVRFELLQITRDSLLRQHFHFRLVNQCPQPLISAAFQIPDGLTAPGPVDNIAVAAPSGRVYATQNPNFSPFYSVRFIAQDGGIPVGQAEEFCYTLPRQADPSYIHIVTRPRGQEFIETYLNTFGCPVTDDVSATRANSSGKLFKNPDFLLFPNPTAGALFADLSGWMGQAVQIHVLNAQGQLVQSIETTAEMHTPVVLPDGLCDGLFWLELCAGNGERQLRRFVLNR